MIVRSQNMHIALRREEIRKTELQHKDPDNVWLVVAITEDNRAITLARYPSEKEALSADNKMWFCKDEMYVYPVLSGKEGI